MKLPADQPLTMRILKGSSIVLLFTFAVAPLGYLFRMMLSRMLSIEMYGLFYALISFFSFFITYNDLGFGYSLSYFFPKYFKKKDYRTCWHLYLYDQTIELGTSLAISIILFAAAPWLSRYYFKIPEAEYLVRILCIYFVANSFVSALNKLYNGLQKEIYYASMEFFRFLFLIIITTVLYLKNASGVSAYIWGFISSYIFVAFLYRVLLQRKFSVLVHQSQYWDRNLFQTMAKYAIPTVVTTSIYTLITFSDTFFLTVFRGIKEVGIYNVMLPVVSVFAIFLSPLNVFLFPLISRHIDADKEKIRTLFLHVLKIVPFICLYFAIFIILFPNPIISILFGNKWSNTYAVGLSILSIGFTLTSLASFFTTFVIGIGKVRERLKVSFIIAIVNIIGGLLLIPRYGVIGVAASLVITSILSLILLGQIIRFTLPFKYPVVFYGKILLLGSALFILCRYFGISPSKWFQLITYGIVYTIIMGVFGLWIGVYPDLWQLLPKKK